MYLNVDKYIASILEYLDFLNNCGHFFFFFRTNNAQLQRAIAAHSENLRVLAMPLNELNRRISGPVVKPCSFRLFSYITHIHFWIILDIALESFKFMLIYGILPWVALKVLEKIGVQIWCLQIAWMLLIVHIGMKCLVWMQCTSTCRIWIWLIISYEEYMMFYIWMEYIYIYITVDNIYHLYHLYH